MQVVRLQLFKKEALAMRFPLYFANFLRTFIYRTSLDDCFCKLELYRLPNPSVYDRTFFMLLQLQIQANLSMSQNT